MINNKTVTHCLDFFIKKETEANNEPVFISYFNVLKNIFHDSLNNDFAKKNIISTIYSKIKTDQLTISEFISDPEMLSFFSNYNSFSETFISEYKNELSKIKSEFSKIINLDSLNNQDEILSYCITESLIEYSKADIKFIPNTTNVEAPYSNTLINTIHSVKNEFDILPTLHNKSFGLYVFKVPYQKMVGNSYKITNSVCFVSHQSNGTTLFNLDNIILHRGGLRGTSLNLENILSKSHDIIIETKQQTDTELTTIRNLSEFDGLFLVNKLTLISLSAIVSRNEERKINETKFNCLVGLTNKSEKSLLPVVSSFKSTELPYISFDELRFKGKYSFLSKLDDLLEDIIDMDVVNFRSDRTDCYFDLTMNQEETKDEYFGNLFKRSFEPKVFTKEDFNQFIVKEITYNNAYRGIETSPRNISPLNHSFIGTEEEIYNHCFSLAKMNKLTLYSLYLNFYYDINSTVFMDDMNVFINDNIVELAEDEDLFSLLNSVGHCRNSSRNYSHASWGTNEVFVSEKSKQRANAKELKSFNSDKKATYLISMLFNKPEIYDILINKYGLDSKIGTFFIEHYKMSIKLDNIYASIEMENKRRSGFFGFINNNVDLELQNWYYAAFPLSIILPVNNKQHKNILAKFEKYNVEIQDTSSATGHDIRDRN